MDAEHPMDVAALVASASHVIGTTRAEFAEALARPPGDASGHLTAIAWVVDPAVTRLLLVRHRLHGWSCPGGHVEAGEDPAATATRELLEETGIRASPRQEPLTISTSLGCARDPGTRHWTLGYLFAVDVAVAAETHGEPGQPASWFALDELPAPRSSDIDAVAIALRTMSWSGSATPLSGGEPRCGGRVEVPGRQ